MNYTLEILEPQINEIKEYPYFRTKVKINNQQVRHQVWNNIEPNLFIEIKNTINAFVDNFPQTIIVKNQPIVAEWLLD